MKKIKLYITAFLTAVLFAVGCDKGFDEMNTDPINLTKLDPSIVFNSAVNDLSQDAVVIYQHYHIVQWIVTPFGGDLQGANYNMWHSRQNSQWQSLYQNAVPKLVYVIERVKDDNTRSNLYQAARIMKAFTFQQLTDTYGDIPYSEAGLGYSEQLITPRYEAQQDIYKDLLKELDEASAALDPAKGAIAGEIFYGGNVAKWKKFGYSMLLRTAMRLSKVDPATAETYVKKAVAGGLFDSNADNAIYKHTSEFRNSVGNNMSGTERGNLYAAKPLVDFLRSTNDPRMAVLLHRYVGASSSTTQINGGANNNRTKDIALQIGMPIGYNNSTIVEVAQADLSETSRGAFYGYSQFDNFLLFHNTAPEWHCTYGQNQLLLAEAMIRGWIPGDPKAAFENAVKANMELYAEFGSAAAIPAASINAYIAAHPLDMSTKEKTIEQINTEYWVGSIPNGIEAWANWRRTNYPKLTPNPYPSSEVPGDFIRRHKYPDRENITNKVNLEWALNRLGGVDKMNARIWWHVE